MNNTSQKLKIDLSFMDNGSSQEKVWTCAYCNKEFDTKEKVDKHEETCKLNAQNNKNEVSEEYVWSCDNCGKEFDSQEEADKHEETCKQQNNIVQKIYCIKCGTENQNDANYCKKCGTQIMENIDSDGENANKMEGVSIKSLQKNDKRFKSIYNAGTSAEALGWFNLVISIILLFIGMIGSAGGTYMFGLICTIIVSYVFIKYGKNLKNVNNASMDDISILLWTCVGIVVVAIFTEGSIGFLFLLELFYIFKAKSVIKNLK